ncbi:thiamine pyrophosphate-requiring protein [Haloactinomyces albus]|uniref:Pyruvate dehydrogenase (Quinone) n=1 Tax=Haloactinomyces albus TaxID=1352928 RepID=A0AAE4CLR7_9ACTN|nr:thiamine pyrophosphate-requiring protein [Haloactinomyces albus]MDR7300222.1 pyruvate dehydrogenase (quinone) [Haloactinomyces albus]
MAQQVADFVVQRIREWGIHSVYGYPGDGINGLLGALNRAQGDPEFLQARHEEMAAFMATGHAKFTGNIGCCTGTSGGGAVHLLNGLYDAKLDRKPVLALVGQQKRVSLGSNYQQEVDLTTLFRDVSEFVQVCMEPAQARMLVDRAIKTALTRRGVATLIFPGDVQEEEAVTSPPRMHGSTYTSIGWSRPRMLPDPTELEKAAEVLNSSSKVAMLVGQGVQGATQEVLDVADTLGAGITKGLVGRAVVPDDLPHVTGPIGLLGSAPSDEMVMNCDTLFVVGSSFPYAEWLPEEGSARGVQIDNDGTMVGARYPMDAHVVGDAKETLRELLPLLERKQDRSWRETIESNVREWEDVLERRAHQEVQAVNPELAARELSPLLPDRCILTCDTGSITNWWARHLTLRDGMDASLAGTLASMGPGTPYAIAARFAYPDRPVIAFVGDGAFQMNGMLELITVRRYLSRMRGAPLIFCVFNNQDLNQVTWEQRAMAGDPKFEASQDIPDVPYAEFARMLGLEGIHCDRQDGVTEAWQQALAADRPVVLEFKVDPEIPPIPPHIKPEQAKKTAKAIASGDPEAAGITKTGFRQKMAEFYAKLPSRS